MQSGRPVSVTGPALADEFDHHRRFKALIGRGAIVLVAREPGREAYADRIVAALKQPPAQAPFDFNGWWQDVVEAVRAQLPVTPLSETAPDSAARTPRAGT